jgi:chemotaxis protein CheD
MKPNFIGIPTMYIHPGEVCFSKRNVVISTLLGSCVAITMFSKKIKFSGISHCQLPKCNDADIKCENCGESFKYVNCTIVKMIEKFEQLNIKRSEIEVKLFGGADVLNSLLSTTNVNSVGKQNILTAKNSIHKYNLNLVASDVGGKQGRKLFFLTTSGEIFLYRMKSNEKN